MAQKSKIKLTNDELNLICSTLYPKLKKSAMNQLAQLMQEAAGLNLPLFQNLRPDYQLNSKLSAGENFDDCPWLVMDIPQLKKDNYPFGGRIFFRWAQHFAFQFFVERQQMSSQQFLEWVKNCPMECRILVSTNLWENRWEATDFKGSEETSLSELEETTEATGYYKLIAILPIKKSDELPEQSTGFFSYWLEAIKSSSK